MLNTFTCFALAFALLILPVPASSQDDVIRFDIEIVEVQPGKEQAFIDLQAKISRSLAAEGLRPRDVWVEVNDGPGRFHIVDPEGEDGRWDQAADDLIASRKVLSLQLYPHLSTMPTLNKRPDYLTLTTTTVRPDQHVTYEAWLQSFLRPAFIATGIDGASFTRVVSGGDTNQWVRSVPTISEDNQSVVRFVDRLDNEYRKTFIESVEALREVVESTEILLLRHVPEASISID